MLSNPPAETSGLRTLARVEQARSILGYDTAEVVNLFSIPTYRTGEISRVGATAPGWDSAKVILERALTKADAVLLAYGCQVPTGPARLLFRAQVDWLVSEISRRGITTWTVAGRPLHPSRWQRHTYAHHRGVPFGDALAIALEMQAPIGR
ncbi:DUF1643 domain-containing protein [Paenarthrobacter ilicis]|uniref:DUF1643 domain-containing protein n=1 Tax=Paenarthrobacter ilicis TaxID=43665 RepID=UPI003B84922D